MKRVLVLLAALVATVVTFEKSPRFSYEYTPVQEPVALSPELWRYACEYVDVFHGISCEGIEPPKVVWSEFRFTTRTGEENLLMYGAHYPGSNYIILNVAYAQSHMINGIAVHEAVHYIGHQAGAGWSRCEGEEIARHAGDLFNGKTHSDDWKLWYRCQA